MKIFTITTLTLLALLLATQNSNAQCDIIGVWQVKEISMGNEISGGDELLGIDPKIEFTENKIIVTGGNGEYHDEQDYELSLIHI